MSLAQITLTTNKNVSNVGDYVRKIRQNEAGQKLEVIITDADGSGYNLDGKTLEFSENKEGGKIVSDNDQDHFEIKDAKAGRFVYTLVPAVYAASGTAWFDITSADGSVIDTTRNFNIDVIEVESVHINNENYISNLISLETHYDGVIKKAKEDSEALLAKINDQLKANKDANDAEIADVKKQVTDKLTNVKTAPVAVENATTLQQRYPNGADGIFIVADTGHKWLWLSGKWTDCGQYQAIGIDNELIDPIKQQQLIDKENIATNSNLINQNTAQIKENTTDIQSVEGAGALTYVHITDQDGKQITDQNGTRIVGNKWLPMVDKTLTQSDLPADAKSVGDAIAASNQSVSDAIAASNQLVSDAIAKSNQSVSDAIAKSNQSVSDAIAKSNQFDATKYDIPVLYLYGDRITSLKDKKSSLKNEVRYNFPKYHIKGTCTNFKVQGATSAGLPQKNWTLNLDQSIEIFHGYGKQHKYVVKANMTDFSQSRNVVSAKIWGQVEKSRNKAEDILQDDQGNYVTDSSGNHISFTADPQLSIGGNYGAVDGFPIVIYVNDQYWGLYSFNIPKDDWMAKMPKKQGYAILDAVWSPQGGFKAETNLNDGLEVQFSGTENTDWIKTSINKLIDACLAHYDTKEAFDTAVSNLIDINNAIDYLLYSVFIDNDDGVFRNYLLQTFNGTKWYFVPYDLDMTYGRSPQTWRYLSPDDNGQNPYLNGVNLNSLAQNNRLFYQLIKFHRDDLNSRYKELASTSLSVSSLLDSFNEYLVGISKALTDQEVKTWPQTPETQTNNFSQIRWWYDHRINWLNQVFSTTDSPQA